ncbi:IS481 family transposase, partial [Klebsiella pneumoniae]|nr:IS481 family transposase [Klebsiella pneumoniae]MCJ5624064.1 IS481 family transposase [Klebsiella pneumoniae]
SLELMTPVDYILRESKNCNMWWTHTGIGRLMQMERWTLLLQRLSPTLW